MSNWTDFNGVSAQRCARELETGLHGHFAANLASAWFAGDEHNQRLIETTWPHLFEKAAHFIKTAPKGLA